MTLRKLVLNVHLVLGLTAGLLLTSAGLTGSLLVWRAEIDAALHPELLRVEPGPSRAPLQHAVEQVRAAFPESPVLYVRVAREPRTTHTVVVGGTEPRQVFVDPYRGTVLGARGETETFANALFHWHHTLFAGETGERVMGATALLLLAMVATGLVVWWPGMRRLGQGLLVKWRRAGWKRRNFDLHRAGGFWSTAFLVLVAVTGSSLVFHDAYMAGLNRVTGSPPRPAAPVVEPVPGAPALPLDRLVEMAMARLPGGELTVVTLPQAATAPVVVRGKVDAELHPNGRNFLYLHPQTGQFLAAEHALTAPAGTRAYNILYPLHIGRWGGTLTRVLYSLLGLVPLGLLVSGVLMWRNRTGGKKRTERGRTGGRRPRKRARSGRAAVGAGVRVE